MPLETVWLVLGVAILVVTFGDALWTTLWVDGGGGPLTSRVTTWAWRGVLALVGRRRHRALSLFGPATIVGVVVLWGLLLWVGWTFVYASEPRAVVAGLPPHAPADWTDRIWFVAFSISTMGNGDFNPSGDGWQLVASLTALSGFFLVTLVISYLISVISAVVAKRAFAGAVTSLGRTAEDALRNAWDGRSFRTLDLPINGLSTALGALTEQYLSYPVLQYYHGAEAKKSPAIGLVVFDEMLTILRFGIPEDRRPNPAVLHAAREGVGSYLETLASAFIHESDENPPRPDLRALRDAGIPTLDDRDFDAALARLGERRRKLLGLLRANGWNWDDR